MARLPWRGRWLTWLWGGLVGTALVYAAIGVYQWSTREVFWNPKVKVGNAYAPFFRVNSVFWDPSIYGRYLVVGILTALAGVLLRGVSGKQVWGLVALIAAMWVGLFFSFSQTSFVALAVGVTAAAVVVWGRRALLAGAALALVVALGTLAIPQVRNRVLDQKRFDKVTSGRASLVGQGARIALAHPLFGVGVGDFKSAYAARAGLHGRQTKLGASHTTPITVAAETGLVGLAAFIWLLLAALSATLAAARPRLHLARVVRRWPYATGDRRAQRLLQRVLRGPDDVGPAWPHGPCDKRAAASGRAGSRAVIEAFKRALVLAPHTDDGEFGCGGTAARLVEAGCEVRYVAFSIATRSLPAGFPPDTLAKEVRAATAELGIPESGLTVHNFDVRTFPERRQDILELLVALWEDYRPDVVFQPSHHDVHQDHQTIAQEGLRAFKRTTILGYEIPWNNFEFSYGAYVSLEERHISRKVAAVQCYESQQHRRYANEDFIRNLARVHGTNVNREYAEVFQVYRLVV